MWETFYDRFSRNLHSPDGCKALTHKTAQKSPRQHDFVSEDEKWMLACGVWRRHAVRTGVGGRTRHICLRDLPGALVVKTHTPTAGGMRSVPGGGSRSACHVVRLKRKQEESRCILHLI